MGNKENDSKGEERENGKVRTSFALTQFLEIVEALNKANIGIAKLSYRYDVDEERRCVLNDISNTITQDFYCKLEKIIGSDFVECALNTINK